MELDAFFWAITIGRLSAEQKRHHIRQSKRSLACEGKALLGKSLTAQSQTADRSFNGTISPESLARYEDWKQAVNGAAVSG